MPEVHVGAWSAGKKTMLHLEFGFLSSSAQEGTHPAGIGHLQERTKP